MPEPSETTRVRARKRGPKKVSEISRLKKEVISKLCAGCSYTKAAKCLGIERNTIKAWRRNDEQFEAACEYARQMTVERVEDAMYEAALKVSENPRYTTAAIFWLKNRSPGRWRDVHNVRHTDEYAEMVEKMPVAQIMRMIEVSQTKITSVSLEELEKADTRKLLPPPEDEHATSYDEMVSERDKS